MKGIILAAGRGSRMGSLTEKLPKCRTVLHGKELIQWQLTALSTASINDIAIVRGYLPETFDFDVTYFENKQWATTNMVVSLLAAEAWLENDICITSYSDIVYSPDAVRRLVKATGDIVIAYDPNWIDLWSMRFEDPLSDAETFRLDGNRVVEIGSRSSSLEEIEGQYMGLVKYTPNGWLQVRKYLKEFTQEELSKLDMTTLIQGLINVGIEVTGIPIADRWFEVDTESDLRTYQSKFARNSINL